MGGKESHQVSQFNTHHRACPTMTLHTYHSLQDILALALTSSLAGLLAFASGGLSLLLRHRMLRWIARAWVGALGGFIVLVAGW